MRRAWILAVVLAIAFAASDFTCESDSDCDPPYETCSASKGECVHKSVFPLEALEFVGSFVLGIILALCNAAGVGGGGIVIPICIIFFRFSTTHSIALSNFNIFSASITRFILNFKSKHPLKLKKAVIVDYEACMLMLPAVLLGGLIGVQLNSILPDVVVLVLLTILLIFMTYKSVMQGIKKFRAENKERKAKQAIQETEEEGNGEEKQEDTPSPPNLEDQVEAVNKEEATAESALPPIKGAEKTDAMDVEGGQSPNIAIPADQLKRLEESKEEAKETIDQESDKSDQNLNDPERQKDVSP